MLAEPVIRPIPGARPELGLDNSLSPSAPEAIKEMIIEKLLTTTVITNKSSYIVLKTSHVVLITIFKFYPIIYYFYNNQCTNKLQSLKLNFIVELVISE